MLEPQGRVILISGASRGIGRAVAEKLYALGYSLSLGLRNPSAADPYFAQYDRKRLHCAAFLAEDWSSHRAWIENTLSYFGRIDGLVANAGAHSAMTLRAPDEAVLDHLWSVNCKAPLNLIHCALPHLEVSGTGRIITVASMSGKRVRNDAVAYNMTKFATVALTHAARRIGWEKGVRATALCPSFVRTDMTAGALFPTEQMTTADDLAEVVATVLALPNTASVAEVLVNCRLEDTL